MSALHHTFLQFTTFMFTSINNIFILRVPQSTSLCTSVYFFVYLSLLLCVPQSTSLCTSVYFFVYLSLLLRVPQSTPVFPIVTKNITCSKPYKPNTILHITTASSILSCLTYNCHLFCVSNSALLIFLKQKIISHSLN